MDFPRLSQIGEVWFVFPLIILGIFLYAVAYEWNRQK